MDISVKISLNILEALQVIHAPSREFLTLFPESFLKMIAKAVYWVVSLVRCGNHYVAILLAKTPR